MHQRRRPAAFDQPLRQLLQHRRIRNRRARRLIRPVDDALDAVRELIERVIERIAAAMIEHDAVQCTARFDVDICAAAIGKSHAGEFRLTLDDEATEDLVKDRALERHRFAIAEALNENIEAHGRNPVNVLATPRRAPGTLLEQKENIVNCEDLPNLARIRPTLYSLSVAEGERGHMAGERIFAVVLAIVFWLLPYGVKEVPQAVAWVGIGGALIIGAMTFAQVPDRYLWPISLAIAGILALFSSSLWLYQVVKNPEQEPFFYFDVDFINQSDLTAANPGRIVNNNDFAFHNIVSWFSPSAARRDPKRADSLYWSLPQLKVTWTPLYKGQFWTGKKIPPGDYCIESNSLRDGTSPGFVERLQVLPFEGRLIQVIDVWSENNKLIWSSPRPKGFKETQVPWLN
jgi:hypothetical protein